MTISLAATAGDPTSIGPEVAVSAIVEFLGRHADAKVRLFCPHRALRPYLPKAIPDRLQIFDSPTPQIFRPGKPSIHSAAQALESLNDATDLCLTKVCQVLVTGPVDKHWCAKVDPTFRGHTEYLERRSRVDGTTMLLAGSNLRVALVTTHLPLKDVSRKLTKPSIVETGIRTHDFLKRLKDKRPIAVLGLNPHASDHGLFGSEEAKVIIPAIRTLNQKGIRAEGPFSADSFFHQPERYGAVICMYHDQGLIPLKLRHFYDAVNITLGLPFLRVSVDHGTAFDLAGKGKASDESYAAALEFGYRWAKKRPAIHSNPRSTRT